MAGYGQEPQSVQYAAGMKDYSPNKSTNPDKFAQRSTRRAWRLRFEYKKYNDLKQQLRRRLIMRLIRCAANSRAYALTLHLLKYLDRVFNAPHLLGASSCSGAGSSGGGAGFSKDTGRGPPAWSHAPSLTSIALIGGLSACSLLATATIASADNGVQAGDAEPANVALKLSGEIHAAGGVYNGNASVIGGVKAITTLNDVLGIQVDGNSGSIANKAYNGVTGHLFYKFENGKIGVFQSYDKLDNTSMNRSGVEGQIFLNDKLHLEGNVGVQYGRVTDGVFAGVTVKYFPDKNLMIFGGVDFAPKTTTGKIGAEYQIANGVSIYGIARSDFKNNSGIFAGLRVALDGTNKTLEQRKRESFTTNTPLEELMHNAAMKNKHDHKHDGGNNNGGGTGGGGTGGGTGGGGGPPPAL